jgi:hypothetical protein
MKVRKTVAESLDPKYHIEPATSLKLDIDSGRTKDSGARLTYELRNYVTTLRCPLNSTLYFIFEHIIIDPLTSFRFIVKLLTI